MQIQFGHSINGQTSDRSSLLLNAHDKGLKTTTRRRSVFWRDISLIKKSTHEAVENHRSAGIGK